LKKLSVIFISLVLLAALPNNSWAEEQPIERPIVAVFEMQDRGSGLDIEVLKKLTSYLAARLVEGGYQVIPQDQIRQRLLEQKTDSYKKCHDDSCQIELGRELAAQKSLSTQILKIGKTCRVTATLYDLKKSAAERGATAGGACQEDLLLGALEEIAMKLCEPLAPKKLTKVDTPDSKVKRLPGTLVVNTEPKGVTINVGGEAVGKTPLTVELASGDYPVVASRPGFAEIKTRANVVSGQKIQIELELEGIYPMHPMDKWGHASFWSGIGLLALSGVSAIEVVLNRESYKDGDWGAEDDVRTWTGVMWAGLGVGSALVATGIVLWVLAPEEAEWIEEWVQSQKANVAVTPDGSGVVFSMGGRW
jgi:PEGA domain-containing protein